MSLLQLKPRLLRITGAPLRATGGSIALWLATLVGLEFFGRWTASDLGDALGVLVLGALILATELWHQQAPLPWVASIHALAGRIATAIAARWAAAGIDFRGEPPLPRGIPKLTLLSTAIAAVSAGLVLVSPASFPGALRLYVAPVSYCAYVSFLALLWAVLVVGIVATGFLAYMLIHDFFVHRYTRPEPRSLDRELCVFSIHCVTVLIGLAFAPVWVPLAVLTFLPFVLFLAYGLPQIPRFHLAWREKLAGSRLRSISFKWLNGLQFTTIFLALITLVLLSRGDALFGPGELAPARASMPITRALGALFAWGAAGGMSVCVTSVLWELIIGARLSRTNLSRPGLVIAAPTAPKRQIRRNLARHGFRVRFWARRRKSTEIRVELGPDPLERIENPAFQAEVRRREEIQCRRVLVRRLRRLLRIARRRNFHKGNGYWIGAHQWFIRGLARDCDEDEFDGARDTFVSGSVGPAFDQLIEARARYHFGVVMKALDLDLIFVEDGVPFRRLRQVLRMLFEIYDIHGGRRRAHEKYLRGIPGLRIIIHDVGLEATSTAPGYPEPDYEDIGRARILHVFRDRGEEGEEKETSPERDRIPALV